MKTRGTQGRQADIQRAAAVHDFTTEQAVFAQHPALHAQVRACRAVDPQTRLDTRHHFHGHIAEYRLDQLLQPQGRAWVLVEQPGITQQIVGLIALLGTRIRDADQRLQLTQALDVAPLGNVDPDPMLFPGAKQQRIERGMQDVEKVTSRRVALQLLVDQVFGVERRQRRGHAIQAEKVRLDPIATVFVLLDPLDIPQRKPEPQPRPDPHVVDEVFFAREPQAQQAQGLEKPELAAVIEQRIDHNRRWCPIFAGHFKVSWLTLSNSVKAVKLLMAVQPAKNSSSTQPNR